MRYQYQSQGFKNDFYGMKNNFNTNPVFLIILINTLIYLTTNNQWAIHQIFGISSTNFKIWQPITYMFLHGGLTHLFFNMFLLWMFGSRLQTIWGPAKFIRYYFITGIGAGILIYIFSDAVTIGASGAIMAILFAYGYIYPNQILFLWFIPMKAKYAILMLIFLEISQELARNPGDNISHIGHLGGMLIGFLYLKFGHQILKSLPFIKIKKAENPNQNISLNNIDDILDKLKIEGWDGLSDKEKSILFQESKKRNQEDHHVN
jgi:membrane associated rhomboid family serine protease